jgi:MFS family permease
VTAYLLAATVSGPVYGKLGDLYGRRVLLQSAIVIFLVGSALCGISENMFELIVFRAIEGLGGGGLFVVTIAVVGDIIAPPRARPLPGILFPRPLGRRGRGKNARARARGSRAPLPACCQRAFSLPP